MQKNLIVVCLLLFSSNLLAQSFFIKAGINFNADIADHKLGKLNYPSYELNFERVLGNKFSFNAGYNYAKRDYRVNNEFNFPSFAPTPYNRRWTSDDHAFLLSGRYYLKTNKQGLFFELGNSFTYSIEKDFINEQKIYEHGWWSINTFAGTGIKYPLNSKCGVEMNMSISPPLNFLGVDYGTAGFIKSGLKFYWNPGSKK